jgi:hypothetical protein
MRVLIVFLFMIIITVLLIGGCGSLIVMQKSVEDLRDQRGFTWVAHETDEFAIFAEGMSPAADKLPMIAASAIESKQHILTALDLSAYEHKVSIFLVDSRERMRELIGRETNATGFHTTNAVCLVWARSGTSGLRHEMTHIIAMNAWGVPERWVNEGVAVDVTGLWVGQNVDATCRILRDRGELPSLDKLIDNFNQLQIRPETPALLTNRSR